MFRGMKSFSARTGILATLTTALAFFCPAQFSKAQVPAPQTQARRLILKDGSYQSVTKYELHGQRGPRFSAGGGEREELPKSLIDGAETDKLEQGRLQGKLAPEAVELDKE